MIYPRKNDNRKEEHWCEECYQSSDFAFGPFMCPVCKKSVCADCTNYCNYGPCIECEPKLKGIQIEYVNEFDTSKEE